MDEKGSQITTRIPSLTMLDPGVHNHPFLYTFKDLPALLFISMPVLIGGKPALAVNLYPRKYIENAHYKNGLNWLQTQ